MASQSLLISCSESALMRNPSVRLPPSSVETACPTAPRASRTLDQPLRPSPPGENCVGSQPASFEPRYCIHVRKGLNMETYEGHVRTPGDAIILFEACRLGMLPRVQRRLSEKERQSIKSGSVFVWDEREAGMRRWTDGKSWSASRVSGSFLTYREMEGKRGGGGNGYPPPVTALSRTGRTPESQHSGESDLDMTTEEGPDGYRYKPDGLVKQSFSITTSSGNHLHLISYYSRAHPASQQLNSPSSDPQLRQIRPAKGMYPESTVHEHHNIPAVTRSPMAGVPYTTTPQMAGYARQGPPQWPQQQGYAWSQPQQQQSNYPYHNHQYAPSPYANGSSQPANSQSSLQYNQPAPPQTPQPLERSYSNYENRPPPANQDYQAYDSRRYAQAPPQDSRPPASQPQFFKTEESRPNPSQQPPYSNGMHSNGYRDAQSTTCNDPRYQPRQTPAPELRSPPSQSQHSRPKSHGNGIAHQASFQQTWSSGPLPPPQTSMASPPAQVRSSQHAQPTSTPIDPVLMGGAPAAPPRVGHATDASRPAAPQPLRVETNGRSSSLVNGYGTSAASSIPNINALIHPSGPKRTSNGNVALPVNGHTTNGLSTNGYAPNGHSTNGHAPNGQSVNGYHGYPQSSETKSPPISSPPPSIKRQEDHRDMPKDKSGFGEDRKALNMLNRVFVA